MRSRGISPHSVPVSCSQPGWSFPWGLSNSFPTLCSTPAFLLVLEQPPGSHPRASVLVSCIQDISFPKYIQVLPPPLLLGLSSKATLFVTQSLNTLFKTAAPPPSDPFSYLFVVCLPFLECQLHDSERFWLFCFLFFPAHNSRHTINICWMNERMNLSSIPFSGGWRGEGIHELRQGKNVETLWRNFILTWHSVPSAYVGTRNTRNAGDTCSILWWICLQRL